MLFRGDMASNAGLYAFLSRIFTELISILPTGLPPPPSKRA